MLTTEPTESPPPLFAAKWALRFGAAWCAALALVVALVTWDGMQRGRLESATETTAVGDRRFFKLPTTLPARASPLEAISLVVFSREKIEVRDTHVRRVAVDAGSGLAFYQLSAAATEEERASGGLNGNDYLIKVAPGEYVKAHAAER